MTGYTIGYTKFVCANTFYAKNSSDVQTVNLTHLLFIISTEDTILQDKLSVACFSTYSTILQDKLSVACFSTYRE